jgi:hypothetical protein
VIGANKDAPNLTEEYGKPNHSPLELIAMPRTKKLAITVNSNNFKVYIWRRTALRIGVRKETLDD